jgi:hypothetical protein
MRFENIYNADTIVLITNSSHISAREIMSYDAVVEKDVKLISFIIKDGENIIIRSIKDIT